MGKPNGQPPGLPLLRDHRRFAPPPLLRGNIFIERDTPTRRGGCTRQAGVVHHLLLRPKDDEHIIAFHLWKALHNAVVPDILHEPRE